MHCDRGFCSSNHLLIKHWLLLCFNAASLCHQFKWLDYHFRALSCNHTNNCFDRWLQLLQKIGKVCKAFESEFRIFKTHCHRTYNPVGGPVSRSIQSPIVALAVSSRGSRTLLSAHPKGLSLFLGTGLSWGRRLPSARLIRGIPHLLDDSLLMMVLTGRMEFRSFLCCRIRLDCTETERWEAGGLDCSNLEKERQYEGSIVIRTGMYLNKLSFNGLKLDLLVDCPGNVIPFKRLWNTRNWCYSLNM